MPEGPELPASIARRHFHWCLASVILPVISLPVEWALALADRSASGAMPEERRWSHSLTRWSPPSSSPWLPPACGGGTP